MSQDQKLARSLLMLRLGVFVVFFIWVVDKFLRPDHTATVWQHFYFAPSFGSTISYCIGAIQGFILIGFLIGFKKRFTYGAILLLHAVSTFSCMKQYLTPFDGPNILFFAAWPMLAACYALYILRDQDTLWNYKSSH